MDVTTASFKSDDVSSTVAPAPPPEAGVGSGHLWRARKAIYGLAHGPNAFYRTLDDFLRTKTSGALKLAFPLFKPRLIRVIIRSPRCMNGRIRTWHAIPAWMMGGVWLISLPLRIAPLGKCSVGRWAAALAL